MSRHREVTIGIDARSLVRQPTGVGRYVRNLVRSLSAMAGAERIRLYLPAGEADDCGEGVERRYLASVPGLDNIFTWNHVRLPMHLMRRPVDLFHSPFYTLPAFCPSPAVVTIHDITFDIHPEWFTPRARLSFGGFAARSARKARHVLTVSEFSRKDIIERYGVSPSQVTAIHLAPDPVFRPVTDAREIDRVKARYETGEEYLLQVGSITPRRNIDRIFEAFGQVRGRLPGLTLVIAGRVEAPSTPVEDAIRRHGLGGGVRVTGYVESSDLPALYSGAVAVAYPSLYEGFGLPVLEAMACGAPVLTSSTTSLPEVAGDAALLVDPLDTSAIAAGLQSLATDQTLRQKLIERGIERAGHFSWERTARRTLEVYRECLAAVATRAAVGGAG